ncbi:MAG: aspartate aminotransferase family protein [Acidobacteria bacterium]|nr:aspartate aminotransferase family protein [Acidobacteriota bacterium]
MPDRYANSRAWLERARQSLTGGVSSPFRAHFPVPLYFEDGCGPRLRDVDGNEYVDYTLAWGPNILGYRHPKVCEAVAAQAQSVHTYGAQHRIEPEVSEKFQRAVPGAERVAFTSSGSEAVQLAMRLARARTGRNRILKFEGHYHGWMDSALLSYRAPADQMGPADGPTVTFGSKGQVANAADNILVAGWNNPAAVERCFERHGGDIAAVITEPVLCNAGCIMPRPGYLEFLRQITEANGSLLIFDEVITGFRIHLGGAQAHFGIIPDLATFGKAVGAGLPLSAIAGRKEVMELMMTGGVAFGGTFNGNPMSLAAANAALEVLAADSGAALRHANAAGESLQRGLREAAARRGVPIHICGFGTAFSVHFTERESLVSYRDMLDDNRERLLAYVRGMLDRGIYLLPDGRVYVSCVHTQREVEETVAAADAVFAEIA